MYVKHLFSQSEYCYVPLEEETINLEDFVILDEEEDEILKLYEDLLNGR